MIKLISVLLHTLNLTVVKAITALPHRFCVAVVLRLLPHAQPGPERLRVLLQDQRAEKEVAGAVQHGNVSRCLSPAHGAAHA